MSKPAKAFSRWRPSSLEHSLPPHGYLYFDHLNAEFQSDPNQNISAELRHVVEDLLKKRQDHSLTWNHLYTFDLILSRLLPLERLAREVWNLRARFRDVAGLTLYEAYLASKPPDLASQTEEKALRSDIEYLLGEIYLRYAITPVNERARDRISSRIMISILGGVGLILFVIILNFWLRERTQSFSATLLPVMFIGAMGGLVSMQQRYQSVSREGDPIDNISQLTQNWSRLFLPAINGAIFAVLFYMIILGGLVQGDLFPKVQNLEDKAGIKLNGLFEYGKPLSSVDYAKLIVWSFLAGFAERLVPDTLTQLISKKDVDKKKAAA
jgi:hypothetical protein